MEIVEALAIASTCAACVSLALSIACIRALKSLRARSPTTVSESVYGRRRHRRVKRYILLKVVCIQGGDLDEELRSLVKHIQRVLGPELSTRCGVALVAYRRDPGRAIIRVSGASDCVKHVLSALALKHIVGAGKCLAVPIRTSGLLTRLRKMLRVYRV